MMRIAICDDEAPARACLASLIRAQDCPCEIVEYASAGECLADAQEMDLLFLDIELNAPGSDGMTLARQIRERSAGTQPVMVFVTGYERYVFDAFDASSGYWRTRNDYPHYLLYQDGDKARETLENWQPTGANPFYGSIDGRFTAPKEIRALGSVPPGSKAVVIHPKVQERMEQDPTYAREIYAKIDAWFAFDAARNEAIMPGSISYRPPSWPRLWRQNPSWPPC